MSGKVLKMKDLIDVKLTVAKDDDDKRSMIVKDDERYVCAVTKDMLSNSVSILLLYISYSLVFLYLSLYQACVFSIKLLSH